MLAEGSDGSLELLSDRVLIRRAGKVTLVVPLEDVEEVRFGKASALVKGNIQVLARRTVIDGMAGTIFYSGKSQEAFTVINDLIRKSIATSPPPTGAPISPNRTAATPKSMKLMLSSGSWLEVLRIKLFPAPSMATIQSMRAQGAKALGGTGAFLGVAGAPNLTFAAEAAAVSLISGFISNVTQKQGIDTLQKAQRLHDAMIKDDGIFIRFQDVANIERASPQLWKGRRDGEDYVHSGEDFIDLETPSGQYLVRWADISVVRFSIEAET